MSRNRVKHAHSLHWATVLRWISLVLLVSILGGSYVALKNKGLRLATEVRARELELGNWKKRNQQLQYNINRISSYEEIQRRITAMGSGMVKISELEVEPMESLRMERSAVAKEGHVTPTP